MAKFTLRQIGHTLQDFKNLDGGLWRKAAELTYMIAVHCLENNHSNAYIVEFIEHLQESNKTMAKAVACAIRDCTAMVVKEDKETGELTAKKSSTVWKRIEKDESEANLMKLASYQKVKDKDGNVTDHGTPLILKEFLPKPATKTKSDKTKEKVAPDSEGADYQCFNIYQSKAKLVGEYCTKIRALDENDEVVKSALEKIEALEAELAEHLAKVKELKQAAVSRRMVNQYA